MDDELPGLSYLRMICEQFPNLEVVRAFNDPLKFIEESKKLEFDFCILDIEMPHHTGLEIAQFLKNKPVIFTSAYKEYAAEAFDIDAIDYIRKPIQKERLEKAIQKAADKLATRQTEKKFIHLNTNKGKMLIYFNQILRITVSEFDKRDKLVLLESGEDVVVKNISFDQWLGDLPVSAFCRLNKRDVVALRCVKHYSHNEVTMLFKDKTIVLPLSDNFKKDFLQKLRA